MDLFDIAIAKKLSGGSGGGGNPNTVQTVTGTVASMWGDIDLDALLTALLNMEATVYAYLNASAIGMGEFRFMIYPFKDGSYGGMYVTASDITPNGSSASVKAYSIFWELDGSLTYYDYVDNGAYTDATAYASYITTELTVVWHPLPTD